MKTKSLGRGLRALIPEDPFLEETARVTDIEVAHIDANPYQPRKDFAPEALEELKESIKKDGLLQPIVVRPKGEKYEIIVGERRLRAAKMAGLTRIPAMILPELPDQQLLEMALVENLQREDLNPIEVAEGLNELIIQFKLTQEQAAEKIGKQRATVANLLRLLKLPEDIRDGVRTGQLSMGHARALLALDDPAQQRSLYLRTIRKNLSVRRVEQLINQLSSPSKDDEIQKPATLFISRTEDRLRSLLGTQVRIKNRPRGGVINIEYYDDEDLERLLELFEFIEKET
jgi:ParB family chromosome partitioning protein